MISEDYDLIEELKKGRFHFTLIDPEDQSPKRAAEIAKIAEEAGSNAIMVGGSSVEDRKIVHETVKAIKKVVKIPVVLFPNSAEGVCGDADYVFFMMLLNSRKIKYLTGEQLKGAPLVRKYELKTISMGYILVSTSKEPTTVEQLADPDKIEEKDWEKAVDYALIAQYIGMDCIYLEAGSGADRPVPKEIIWAVREAVDIPIIVGGAIKDGRAAKEKRNAGAHAINTGTIVEEKSKKNDQELKERLIEIISAIKEQ